MRTLSLAAIIVALCLAPSTASAGDHALYLEGLGNVPWVSVNYDWRFASRFSLRAGVAAAGHESTGFFPLLTANYLADLGGSSNLEIGVGATVNEEEEFGETVRFTAVTGNISYRYQPRDGILFFKAGIAGLKAVAPSNADYFLVLPGVAVGITF